MMEGLIALRREQELGVIERAQEFLREGGLDEAATALERIKPAIMLTPCELQTVVMLARGLTVKEIAIARNRAVKTIEVQKQRVYWKLGIHHIAELIHWALYNGIVKNICEGREGK